MDGLTEEIKNMTLGQILNKLNLAKNEENNVKKNDIKEIIEYFEDKPEIINKGIYINSNGELHSINDEPAYIVLNEKGVIIERQWFKNAMLHRDNDKPALIIYDNKGVKMLEQWYQNGKLHRDGNPAYMNYFLGTVNIKKWYQNGELHREDDQPACIFYKTINEVNYVIRCEWYQNGKYYRDNDEPTRVDYYDDGTFCQKVWFNENGKYYRKSNGPVDITYYPNGKTFKEMYKYDDCIYSKCISENGLLTQEKWWDVEYLKLHREDDHPAHLKYNPDGTVVKRWYQNGKFYRVNNQPTKVKYNKDESVHSEFWHDSESNIFMMKYYA